MTDTIYKKLYNVKYHYPRKNGTQDVSKMNSVIDAVQNIFSEHDDGDNFIADVIEYKTGNLKLSVAYQFDKATYQINMKDKTIKFITRMGWDTSFEHFENCAYQLLVSLFGTRLNVHVESIGNSDWFIVN